MKKTTLLTTLFSTFLTLCLISLFSFNSKSATNTDNESVHIPKDYGIGSIIIWPGNSSTIPQGWRLCDGSPLLKTAYPKLFEKLETYWIKDEGYHKDFFRIPDLRGVFIRGANRGRNDIYKAPLDDRKRLYTPSKVSNIDEPGSFQQDAIINIKGSWFGSNPNQTAEGAIKGISSKTGDKNEWGWKSISKGKKFLFDASKSDSVKVGSENRPKNASVHFIIYVGLESLQSQN